MNYDSLFESRKQAILQTKDEYEIKGTTYFVSNDGDDANDGTSPDRAWASLKRVSEAYLYPGDGMIDWTDVGAAIREIGYAGVLSLETVPSGRLDDAAFAEACTDLCRRFRACIGATETLSE
jgi:hypothetical protein